MSIDVIQTMEGPPNGTVMVLIKANGFSQASETFFSWWKRSGEYYKLEVELGADGTVRFLGATIDTTILGGYLRGQAFDIAVVDEATDRRAHAKIIPFPITAESNGGCTGNAEIITKTGRVWLIALSGFGAGETVSVTSVQKKETLKSHLVASEAGEIGFPILYPKRAKGKAQVIAEGSLGCNLTLEFAIGKSALKAK
ncbi:MAG: hypothetical protein IH995_06745 [Proteobacteria bacterium]|nr:hypothetical protein [Pseudomonadota bacterium]